MQKFFNGAGTYSFFKPLSLIIPLFCLLLALVIKAIVGRGRRMMSTIVKSKKYHTLYYSPNYFLLFTLIRYCFF